MDLLIVLTLSACIFSLRFIQWQMFLGRKLGGRYFAYADTWWFLNEARKLKRNHLKIFGKYREDRPEWENDYPPLFQYLLALVPDKYLNGVIKYAVPILDAFTASALFSLLSFATSSWEYGLIGVVIFLSSPMIFQQNFCLCVRPLTILIISITYIFSCSLSIPSFLGMSLLILVILLLHKFATQVVVFTSIVFLVIGRFDYLLALVTGFLVATLVSRGYYLRVLRAHINRLRSSDLRQFADSRAKQPLKRVVVLAVYCPWLMFFIVSVCVLGWNVLSPILIYNFVWILALTILSVATNFWIFRVIGEGWRYLGYLVFPMAFYTASIFDYSTIIQWTYYVITFASIAVSYYYSGRLFRGHQNYLITKEDIEIFKRMLAVDGRTVFAYPNEFTYIIAYFSEKDYAATAEQADVIAINRELADKPLPVTLEEKGYSQRFEESKWVVYSRK